MLQRQQGKGVCGWQVVGWGIKYQTMFLPQSGGGVAVCGGVCVWGWGQQRVAGHNAASHKIWKGKGKGKGKGVHVHAACVQ